MNCNRCNRGGGCADESLACVVSAYVGDPRPVFTNLCARCTKLAMDGGAVVEFDIIPRNLPKWELARLSEMVGCGGLPKETRHYERLAWRREHHVR